MSFRLRKVMFGQRKVNARKSLSLTRSPAMLIFSIVGEMYVHTYDIVFRHKLVPASIMFLRHGSLSMILFMVSYLRTKLWWLLFPTMDKLSDDNMCPPPGRVTATMLSRLSVAPVISKVLRSVDLATKFATILLFPRTVSDSLTPDIFNCRSLDVYADILSSRWSIS